MKIHTLSYHSRNRIEDLTADTGTEISRLLVVARSRNASMNVTGALMFNEGRFTQILEGEKQAVSEIFESIKRDRRHDKVTVVSRQDTFARRFPSWSMAFVGSSQAARSYYSRFVNQADFDWKTVNGDSLGRLMTELVDLDLQSELES